LRAAQLPTNWKVRIVRAELKIVGECGGGLGHLARSSF
jgi:hypothetical protein